ncbi:hypothetical protein [Streptomyces sp. NPDC006335]|uniref:hypothetical protein n=1 Tax=Streptomyces sp. NPDC006335 TaxID=3156895 RepID=UPI0033B785EC
MATASGPMPQVGFVALVEMEERQQPADAHPERQWHLAQASKSLPDVYGGAGEDAVVPALRINLMAGVRS